MRTPHGVLAGLVMTGLAAAPATAGLITLSVNHAGGAGIFTTIGAAVNAANLDTSLANIYDIRIAPDIYVNDFANVRRPMILEAFGGSVMMKATIPLPNSKGIVLTNSSLTVKGITFTGAAISNTLGGNGAGIRDQITGAGTLYVENSIFRGNQEGILTGGSGGKEHVVIKNSKFLDNGNPNASYFQHGIYVNSAATVDISNSVICGQLIGHNIKSRSLKTTITNVQSYEGTLGSGCSRAGSASRGIDIPNGGVATLNDVDLFQGPASQNTAMFEFGAEGLAYTTNSLTMTGVDFVNTKNNGIGIQWFGKTNPCNLINTTFISLTTTQTPAGSCISGTATTGSNLIAVPEPGSLALLLTAFGALALAKEAKRSRACRKLSQIVAAAR
jgi:hypothetical protein